MPTTRPTPPDSPTRSMPAPGRVTTPPAEQRLATPSSIGGTAALPVAVDVGGRDGPEVRRFVEGILGWQPVDPETATVVPPALRLVDVLAEAGSGLEGARPAGQPVPTVLLLGDDLEVRPAAEAGARLRPDATLRWPAERDDLEELAAALLRRPVQAPSRTDVVRVAGAGGGVGTSTVALALAGLAAWRARSVLVVVGPGAPVGEVLQVPPDALGAPELLRRATPVPGVTGAAAVRVDGPVPEVEVGAAGADLVVVDAGRHPDADVLVCRPDRSALQTLPTTTAGTVIVNGEGPVPLAALARAAGGRRRVELPRSARVARAGLHARVPASLPGSWLRRLLPVVPGPAGSGPDRTWSEQG